MRYINPPVWLALFAVFIATECLSADDWPQWRGLDRDGISSEEGLNKNWADEGPLVLWRTEVGDGFSGMSVEQGRLITMFGSGGDEVVVAYKADSGEELWRYRLDGLYKNSWGNGPRATPTINDGMVYALSARAKLAALNAASGKMIWQHDLVSTYGATIPTWGVATSPLVEGNLLIVDVGGRGDNGIMAFDKKNGKVVWKSKTALPGYAAPIAISVDGSRQIVAFTGKAAIGIDPRSGDQLWDYEWKTSYDVNAATPVFVAPDKVFISSGYNTGGALLQITAANGTTSVEEVWRSRVMRNHFSSSIYYNGYLYGFDEGTLKCVDAFNQETAWATRGLGKGSLILADGHLIVLSERGKLLLVEATPDEYREKESAQMLRGKCWTLPTLANGTLYIRNEAEMLALDVDGPEEL